MTEGKAKEASRLGTAVLSRSEAAHGRRSICANLAASVLCDAYYELDMIDEAREVLANRTGILQSSVPGVMMQSALCRARLDHLQESTEGALEFLDTHGAHYQSMGLDRPLVCMLSEQIRMVLLKGDRSRIPELTAKLDEMASVHRDSGGYLSEIPALAAIARARVALAESDAANALRFLASAREHAVRFGRQRELVLVELLAAMANDDLGSEQEARDCAIRALELGTRLGLVRTFLDEGKRCAELLSRLRGEPRLDESATQYLDALLARFGTAGHSTTRGDAAAGEGDGGLDHISLTPREIEILGLISQAMSNKRIALTLNITLETVKWNVKNILAKLGMSSRYDAMIWARKKGLIE
jgi:LuxR family maltose regulon positive regulatory protein